MPPASVPAPILLKARAASCFSVFSKMSAASRHSHDHRGEQQNSDPRRPGAPDLHRFDEDQSERQGCYTDIDVNERQLEESAAALEKKRIPSCLGDNKGGSGYSESEGGQQSLRPIFAIFNHVAITRETVESFPIISILRF